MNRVEARQMSRIKEDFMNDSGSGTKSLPPPLAGAERMI
jgi:hypothetical protein